MSVQRLSKAEELSEIEERKRNAFIQAISEKLGNSIKKPEKLPENIELYSEKDEPELTIEDVENDPVDSNGMAIFEKPVIDHLIHAEVSLPKGENIQLAKVLRRSTDNNGQQIGICDENPMLNTMLYDVEFPDGTVREYAANVIAENIYSQVDTDGRSYVMLDTIIDFKKDETAVPKSEQYIITKSGQKHMRKTTTGWKLLVLWKNGTEQWMPLSVLKESNPVDVTDCTKAVGIDHKPVFQ